MSSPASCCARRLPEAVMRSLNVIGAGRVGRTLARLWNQAHVFAVQDILTVHSATAAGAVEFIGAGRAVRAIDEMRPADIWILTLPASRLAECAQQLAVARLLGDGAIVFHCSGSQSSAELKPAADAGACTASVHPLKSFTDAALAVQTFPGTWCGAEGDAAALGVLKPAFEAIGARVFSIDGDSKMIYHAASVIVCNYLAALLEAGVRCYEKSGLTQETAMQAMEPLVRETLDNVFRVGTAEALTGPIARGDHAVVARQLEALAAWDPQIAEIYRQLGAIAIDLARAQGRAGAEALSAIQRTLAGDK